VAREKETSEEVAASLSDILAACPVWVTYVPLRAEVAFRDFVSPPESTDIYEIAPRASLDPFEEAGKAAALAGGRTACVLMPGRAFDAYGTRLGQGGGWYDRFLSAAPKEWTRIGFCAKERFSDARLPRESWDEPVDYVCAADGSEVRSIRTGARHI
jgi:5-formyltetrahydrofolate cyclo-ligase